MTDIVIPSLVLANIKKASLWTVWIYPAPRESYAASSAESPLPAINEWKAADLQKDLKKLAEFQNVWQNVFTNWG